MELTFYLFKNRENRMKNNIIILVALLTLSGCMTTQSGKDPAAYEASLNTAKRVLKSNRALERYENYYDFPSHKAFAQSKVSAAYSYSSFNAEKEYAIEKALELCHEALLKRYDEITDSVSCEIVNIDNEWVTQ